MTDLTLTLEAFALNARVNEFLLDHLTPDDLSVSDGRGGMTVARMLSHMGASRGGWLLEMAPEFAASTLALTGGTDPWRWHTTDPARLRAMLRVGDEAALQAVRAYAASGTPFADPHGVGTFHTRPALFLTYMTVHDAGHRGQIVTLLRHAGASSERLDALEAAWAIWRHPLSLSEETA
ncbi:DinB family protein [Deinococcus sedimenti]|uniref:Damage-inducible protein DinB n=1 Tax=Deinococcus sedimenti TaxID=1867090 RepID=A0ABQ2S5G2_9DEIO|nr:DinB family protein [Deinococcus sedimenti]GGR99339.1 damage-inducible protein DinB [Deinococcus sedimenti]